MLGIKLVDKVVDYQKRLKENDRTIAINLMDFLNKWLTNYIEMTDVKYVPFLKEKEVR